MTLAEYRAREGLTLTALAARLGCPVSTVHGWISGHRRPDWSSLEAIRAATGGVVTPSDFIPAEAPGGGRGAPRTGRGFAESQAPLTAQAQALGLDPEAIAAKAIENAVRAEKARRWQEENREAIEAQNAWIEKHGLPLAKYRMF